MYPTIIALKRVCATAQNMYDAPTVSELRALLTPVPQDPNIARSPWEDAQGRVIQIVSAWQWMTREIAQ